MPTPDPQLHSTRLTAVRDRAGALGIDHVVVYSGEDMSYLTGERMDSHERLTALVVPVAGGEPLLVLPALAVVGTALVVTGIGRALERRRPTGPWWPAAGTARFWTVTTSDTA